jgi:hypothetical protein
LQSAARYAIHIEVDQPVLTTGKVAPDQPSERVTPMKDNARHVPGSNPSRRTPLSLRITPARRSERLGQNADKTQTKCRLNRKYHFFSDSIPTAYNPSAVKCLHSSAHYSFPPSLGLRKLGFSATTPRKPDKSGRFGNRRNRNLHRISYLQDLAIHSSGFLQFILYNMAFLFSRLS